MIIEVIFDTQKEHYAVCFGGMQNRYGKLWPDPSEQTASMKYFKNMDRIHRVLKKHGEVKAKYL